MLFDTVLSAFPSSVRCSAQKGYMDLLIRYHIDVSCHYVRYLDTFNLTSICECFFGASYWVVTVPRGCLKEGCYSKKQRLKIVFIHAH